MKKVLMGVVAIALVAMAGSAMGADTATVTVSANVTGTCQFNTGSYSVTFVLDPAAAGDAVGTVAQPTLWCTKGHPFTITDDNGQYESGSIHQMKLDGSLQYIPYSFTYTASGTGAGKNSPITLDISSQVLLADFVDASAGTYRDTVTLSFLP